MWTVAPWMTMSNPLFYHVSNCLFSALLISWVGLHFDKKRHIFILTSFSGCLFFSPLPFKMGAFRLCKLWVNREGMGREMCKPLPGRSTLRKKPEGHSDTLTACVSDVWSVQISRLINLPVRGRRLERAAAPRRSLNATATDEIL